MRKNDYRNSVSTVFDLHDVGVYEGELVGSSTISISTNVGELVGVYVSVPIVGISLGAKVGIPVGSALQKYRRSMREISQKITESICVHWTDYNNTHTVAPWVDKP